MGEPHGLVRAAGALLWRRAGPVVEVVLVHRPGYDDWTFPKGKAKNGEHLLRTVVREVVEETGIVPVLGRRLRSTAYVHLGRPKRVDYWAAEVRSTGTFTPSHEVDRIAWVPVAEALSRLSYERDAALLREFTPEPTRTLILLRHASAGEKRHWHGSDLLRPLDGRGRKEAAALADLLGAYEPGGIVSSATARCVETVLPYALAHGLPITTDPALTVGIGQTSEAPIRLTSLIHGESLVICTHGEIIPTLVTALYARFEEKIPDDPSLRKASFWVFQLTHDQLLSAERHAVRV
ncbi:MAG: NUDIX domain-containing protein [Streptosporangiaceae bacterium]